MTLRLTVTPGTTVEVRVQMGHNSFCIEGVDETTHAKDHVQEGGVASSPFGGGVALDYETKQHIKNTIQPFVGCQARGASQDLQVGARSDPINLRTKWRSVSCNR